MASKPDNSIGRVALRHNRDGQALILCTMALLAVGVVMVNSALASVNPGRAAWYARSDVRHTLFAGLALGVLLVGWLPDYRLWRWRGNWPVAATVLLALAIVLSALVYVPGIGYERGGYYRWIRVGPRQYGIGFQPSELLKLALVIFLSAWLARPATNPRCWWRTGLPLLGVIGGCLALVVTQDLGTAVVIAAVAGATLILGGVPIWQPLSLGLAGAGAFWLYVSGSPYRLQRIEAMLDPWSMDNAAAYQSRQSLMAVFSGGWLGVGPGQGIRKLGYLPEDSTDFIFAVFVEEWGLIGGLLLMVLVGMWILLARRAAVGTRDGFGRTLAASLGFLVALQALLHIAMGLAAAPPTGMCLPFVSAGGTALLILAAGTALIVSVTAHPADETALETSSPV